MEVDQQTLARILGVSPRTIRSWEAEGLPSAGRGEGDRRHRNYRTEDVLPWVAANKLASGAAPAPGPGEGDGAEPPSKDEADRRWKAARARLKELELRRERGELLSRDAARRKFGKVLDLVRGALLAVPGRYAPRIIGLEGPREAQKALREVVREVLEELSGAREDFREFAGSTELPPDLPGQPELAEAGIESVADLVDAALEERAGGSGGDG